MYVYIYVYVYVYMYTYTHSFVYDDEGLSVYLCIQINDNADDTDDHNCCYYSGLPGIGGMGGAIWNEKEITDYDYLLLLLWSLKRKLLSTTTYYYYYYYLQ